MNANDVSPAPVDSSTSQGRRAGVAFWLGLVVLLAGIVVAVLGVRAVGGAYQRHLDLGQYSQASSEAHSAASIGADAVTTGQRLLELNRSDGTATAEMRQLLIDGNRDGYITRGKDNNRESADQSAMMKAMSTLDDGLRKVLVDHAMRPKSDPPNTVTSAPTNSAPPISIDAWPGATVRTVCLDVQGTFEGQPIDVDQVEAAGALARRLEYRGLTVAVAGMPCDAQLTVRFKGTALSSDYDKTAADKWLLIPDHLYTGARIKGTLALSATGQPPISVDQSIDSAPDKSVTQNVIENMTQPADGLAHIRLWLDKGLTKLGLAEM